jgi:hypothetical protein
VGRANEEQAGGGEADSTDLDEEEGAGDLVGLDYLGGSGLSAHR